MNVYLPNQIECTICHYTWSEGDPKSQHDDDCPAGDSDSESGHLSAEVRCQILTAALRQLVFDIERKASTNLIVDAINEAKAALAKAAP